MRTLEEADAFRKAAEALFQGERSLNDLTEGERLALRIVQRVAASPFDASGTRRLRQVWNVINKGAGNVERRAGAVHLIDYYGSLWGLDWDEAERTKLVDDLVRVLELEDEDFRELRKLPSGQLEQYLARYVPSGPKQNELTAVGILATLIDDDGLKVLGLSAADGLEKIRHALDKSTRP